MLNDLFLATVAWVLMLIVTSISEATIPRFFLL